MAGLANCWKVAHTLWGTGEVIYHTLFGLTAVLWAILLSGYAAKWIFCRVEARAEAGHPIGCCFIGLIPVATLLVAVWISGELPVLGRTLIVSAVIAQLAFSTVRAGGMLRGGRELSNTTAVMYLPTVAGNFVSAIALSAAGWTDAGKMFFGAGLFSWFALESVITYRLYLGEELPKAIRPTLGIQLAPPVVAAVAYLAISEGTMDWPFYALYGYGVLQFLFLARLARWFSASGASPAFWAFSFGVTAMALGCLQAAVLAPASVFAKGALLVFLFANLFIGGLVVMTSWLLLQNRLFRQ